MQPDQIEECISKVQELDLVQQAGCMMLAAQRCEPQLRRWCEQQRADNPLPAFKACFLQWQNGQASDEELEEASIAVDNLLAYDLESQDDPAAAMAVQALASVTAVALDLVPDMPGEILRSGVFFAAVSFCEGQEPPVEIDADCLSEAERQFIADWWEECCRIYPELNS